MFAQLSSVTGRRQRWLRIGSLAFHALLLAWLLHAPEAQLISVSSVASGQNGKSVTRLYWPTKTPDDAARVPPTARRGVIVTSDSATAS